MFGLRVSCCPTTIRHAEHAHTHQVLDGILTHREPVERVGRTRDDRQAEDGICRNGTRAGAHSDAEHRVGQNEQSEARDNGDDRGKGVLIESKVRAVHGVMVEDAHGIPMREVGVWQRRKIGCIAEKLFTKAGVEILMNGFAEGRC